MARIIGSRLLGGIIMLAIALFLIILGAVFTATLVFSFLGIPLIIIGILTLIGAILKIVFGTLGDTLYILLSPFKRKKKETETEEKVIDIEKKDGVYQKK